MVGRTAGGAAEPPAGGNCLGAVGRIPVVPAGITGGGAGAWAELAAAGVIGGVTLRGASTGAAGGTGAGSGGGAGGGASGRGAAMGGVAAGISGRVVGTGPEIEEGAIT